MSKIKKIILGCVVVVISILITALIVILYNLLTRKKKVTETKAPTPAPNPSSSTETKSPIAGSVANLSLKNGDAIRCTTNELRNSNGSIYRNIGESTLSWYPNPEIASSWDPNWRNFSEIDCRDLTLGPNMAKR